MSELDREMLRHLRAYRSETRPAAVERDGALAGLMQRVREGDDVVLDPEPASPRIAAAVRVRWVVAAASMAALAAGASLVASERALDETAPLPSHAAPYESVVPAPAQDVVEVAPPDPPPPVRRVPEPVPTIVAPPPVLAEDAVHPPAPRRAKPKPVTVAPPVVEPPPVIEPSIDAAEVAALRRAQAELSRAPADALARLVDHASTYPASSLGAERDVARATALCKLGRGEEARALAIAFEARRPDSPLLPRMRRICKESRAIADGSAGSSH